MEKKTSTKWFHPRSLLDKTYEIGLFIKGFDGSLELIGGTLLWLTPAHVIEHVTRVVTRNELANDPHDFLATHIVVYSKDLTSGHTTFAILFLLTHGAVKVALVIALLRQKLWAYPWALVALTLFLVYQIYLLVVHPTVWMAILMVLDTIIIWLVWREWRQVRLRTKQPEKNVDVEA